tara:strand:+ start:1676 stop:2926 length:1251 start_codon:yes stop_codon:yes gene_type:complete
MIGFLKKLFAEPQEEEEVIVLDELESWFTEQSKPLIADADASLKSVRGKIVEELGSMSARVEALRDATLRNPDIEVREKQFMEGNRKSYLIGLESFLASLKLPEKTEELEEYLDHFNAALARFTKATVRPYQILQHFFANETGDIAFRIRKLEGLHGELASLTKDGMAVKIAQVGDAIAALHASRAKKGDHEQQLKTFGEQIAGLSKDKKDHLGTLEELRGSVRYQDLLSMKADLAIVTKQLQEHHSSIRQPFSALESALKKYERITLEGGNVIAWYLQDAVEGLERDEELQIVQLVATLQKALESGSLELRDKKRDKAMSASGSITRAVLEEQRKKLVALRSSLEEKGEAIEGHVAGKEEQTMEDAASALAKKIEQVTYEQNELQQSLEKIDVDGEIERTAGLLADVFGKKIVLS